MEEERSNHSKKLEELYKRKEELEKERERHDKILRRATEYPGTVQGLEIDVENTKAEKANIEKELKEIDLKIEKYKRGEIEDEHEDYIKLNDSEYTPINKKISKEDFKPLFTTKIRPDQLINFFIEALDEEIEAVKGKKKKTEIYDGVLEKEGINTFLYKFKIYDFLPIPDDTPAKLEINGKTYKHCSIVTIKGTEIIIESNDKFDGDLKTGTIITDLAFLLKKLQERFNNADLDNFKMSIYLFRGDNKEYKVDVSKELFLSKEPRPNISQRKAIIGSLRNSISFIWGPPGTGKTKTIAKLVKAHIEKGNRVLITSHSNTAVDEALKDILDELLPNKLYDEFKIVRLGMCTKSILEEKYPNVILEKIVEKKEEKLLQEKKIRIKLKEVTEDEINTIRFILNTRRSKENFNSNVLKTHNLFSQIVEEKNKKYMNLSNSELENLEKRLRKEYDEIISEIERIDKKIKEIERKILLESVIVATTITKTFSSPLFPEEPFDAVIIDEASMVSLPYMFWAGGKSKKYLTVVGDFNQLSPICISEDDGAKKWLGRNIYDYLEINDIKRVLYKNWLEDRFFLLDTQYRMNPKISRISNELFYNEKLRDGENTKKNIIKDALSLSNPLILIDTFNENPWACREPKDMKSHMNIFSAVLSILLAKNLLLETNKEIGILTPYKAQVKLMRKIALDLGVLEKLRINTIHSFQGGEKDIIIMDCVEENGVKKPNENGRYLYQGLLKDYKNEQVGSKIETHRILNVALTRAKCKFFMICNSKFFESNLNKEDIFKKLIERMSISATTPPLEDVFYYITEMETQNNFKIFDYDEAQEVIFNDIMNAKEKIYLLSPYIDSKGIHKYMGILSRSSKKGVKVTIITRESKHQNNISEMRFKEIRTLYFQNKIKLIPYDRMNQRVLLIDNKITWFGNQNLLFSADRNKKYKIFRLEGDKTAKTLNEFFNFEKMGHYI